MESTEYKTEDYSVEYDRETDTVTLAGSLRLSGLEDSNPVVKLLNDVLILEPQTITLNLRELEFLNSSGINMLSKFVIKVRQNKSIHLILLASSHIPWQGKSLKNLQRLMPTLELEVQ
ncbi:MAG: slr1659 superfamily regulator [Limnospira sp.]